jgi:hypothetical protein
MLVQRQQQQRRMRSTSLPVTPELMSSSLSSPVCELRLLLLSPQKQQVQQQQWLH